MQPIVYKDKRIKRKSQDFKKKMEKLPFKKSIFQSKPNADFFKKQNEKTTVVIGKNPKESLDFVKHMKEEVKIDNMFIESVEDMQKMNEAY